MRFDSTAPNLSEWGVDYYDEVISLRQCYFYLSLLERFVELTKNTSFNELRVLMACAEYRYFKFTHQNFDFVRNRVPSIDVAFFEQAYLIHLTQDLQNERRLRCYSSETPFHLETICKEATNIKGNSSWKGQMGENVPYQFTRDNFEQACNETWAEMVCIVCFAAIKVKWKAFADWRYDHTVAIQCHTCDAILTRHHFGKANLICDLAEKKPFAISKKYPEIVQLLTTDKAIQRLPFNSGLGGIRSFLLDKLNHKKHNINAFIDEIKSTYFSSPYPAISIDLTRVVADFYAFAHKITQTIDWKLPDDYWKCVYQYRHFANLVFETDTPDMAPIPNIRIDLARHLHMLSPAYYSAYKLSTRVIEIPQDETRAKQLFEITSCEWNLYFAKRKQKAGLFKRLSRKRSKSQSGNYLDYAKEEMSISYKDGHKHFTHFNQLISYMEEKRSIEAITNDANYSKVYQSNDTKASDKRVNITKSPDFDWLVPNTLWTDTLNPYEEYPQYRYKIYLDLGTIGAYFAKLNMPKDAVKKLFYRHPKHHPPMTFVHCYESSGGGGGAN